MKTLDGDIKANYSNMMSFINRTSTIIKGTKNIFRKNFEKSKIKIQLNSFIRSLKAFYNKDGYTIGDLIQLASLLHHMSIIYGNETNFCVFGKDTWKFSYILENEVALEFVVFHIERSGDDFNTKVDYKVSYRSNSDTNYILYQIESTKYKGDQVDVKHDEHTVRSIKVSGNDFKNVQEEMIGKMLGNYIDMLIEEMCESTREYVKNTYLK